MLEAFGGNSAVRAQLDQKRQETALTASDNPRLAVVVIIATVFALALGDAMIKGTSATFTLWQIFVLRSVVVVPILFALIRWRTPQVQLVPNELLWTILRSVCLTLMWVTYYLSLAKVELSIAAAAYYTLPLFITLFAAAFLGDSIGPIGWVAVVLGFFGAGSSGDTGPVRSRCSA